jgi:tetratricopeptide (TPR) repeat protein
LIKQKCKSIIDDGKRIIEGVTTKIVVPSTSFSVLLLALGVPEGRKSEVEFFVPNWVKKAPKWIKRLYLAGFFGAELTKPIRSEKYEMAFEPLKRAFQLNGSDDNLLLKSAWIAEVNDELILAEELYREAINRELELERVYEKLGVILLQLEKYGEAEKIFREAIEFFSGDGKFYFGLSQSVIGTDGKRVDEAEKILRTGIEKDEDFWGNYFLLSTILASDGREDEAEKLYGKAWSLNPNLDRKNEHIEMFQKGSQLIKNGKYEDGIEILEEIVSEDDRFWESYLFLGLAYRQLAQNDEAIKYFTKVLSINPEHAQTHNELAVFFMEEGNYPKALAHAEKACELQPDSAGFLCNFGMAKLYNGEMEEAEKTFMKAKFMDPANEVVKNCLHLLGEVKKTVDNEGLFSKIRKIFKG